MYRHGESLWSVTLDLKRIPRNNKIKQISDTLNVTKENIQESVHPIKSAKEYTITDVEH